MQQGMDLLWSYNGIIVGYFHLTIFILSGFSGYHCHGKAKNPKQNRRRSLEEVVDSMCSFGVRTQAV